MRNFVVFDRSLWSNALIQLRQENAVEEELISNAGGRLEVSQCSFYGNQVVVSSPLRRPARV